MPVEQWTERQVFDYVNKQYTDQSQNDQVHELISRWLKRGDGVAVYENHDLGHPDNGLCRITSFGSASAQMETDDPPTTLPDGIGGSINWRYQLIATFRWAKDDVDLEQPVVDATQSAAKELSSHGALTISEAGLLAELIRGVDRGLKLRIYPMGADDADHPLVVVMRALTYEGGGIYRHDEDIRDAFVWGSGFTEHWHSVSWLIKALSNMDGHLGLSEPMATIDEE